MSRFLPRRWWPAAGLLTPLAAPVLVLESVRFQRAQRRAEAANRRRRAGASSIVLDPVRELEVAVLVEWFAEPGFRGAPGVSYLIRSERGSVLYDVGFGASTPVLAHNARCMGVSASSLSALVISHLHLDHMGGVGAQRKRRVTLPPELGGNGDRPCFLPDRATAPGWQAQVVDGPARLSAGLGTPGPLARGLFFMGYTEELSLVADLEGLGLVVFSGCGHPGLSWMLDMVARVFRKPIYAVVGGLHLPVTSGRGFHGVPLQRLLGTGLPPWRVIDEADVHEAVAALRRHRVKRLLVSPHDSCDEAIQLLKETPRLDTRELSAGATYRL